MANLQNLSPQGYNIQDDPLNLNPFWRGEDVDPSVNTRLTALEQKTTQLENEKADASDLANYYTKTEINNKESALTNRVAQDEQTINALGTTQTAQGQSITALQNADTALGTRLTTAEGKITAIENQLDDIVDASDLAAIQRDLDADELQIDTNKDNITALQQTVSSQGSTIQTIQENQTSQGQTIQNIQNTLPNKANSADVYTKTEVDNLLPDMTDYYTKTEIDDMVGNINEVLEVVLNGNN